MDPENPKGAPDSPKSGHAPDRGRERPKIDAFCYQCVEDEAVVRYTHSAILMAVRVLAVLMTLVIFLGIVDVGYTLYKQFMAEPRYILNINNILETFGAFLAVLIAIEIYMNIVLYLREEVIHMKLVLATALMAAARKVIVFDFSRIHYNYIWAVGVVVIALAASYWLVVISGREDSRPGPGSGSG